tara:strand:+ start:2969 stop:3358 length:390 start_codon:yes stop_codon:yes gene_type:complete
MQNQSFEIIGTLKLVGGIQSFDSGFTKREFVIEVEDGDYPQMVKFECVKERTSLTNNSKANDQVKVSFEIRGNEYKGKYYVNLNAWQVENLSPPAQDGPPDPVAHATAHATAPARAHATAHATEDEIPF